MASAARRRSTLRRQVLPQSGLGWWSVGLAVLMGLLLLVAYIAGALGLETTDFGPAIVIPGALSILSGLASTVMAIVSLGRGERGILVFVAGAAGLLYAGAWIVTIIVGFSGSPPTGPRPSPPA